MIGAPQAEDKLNYAGALVRSKFDFNATDKEELAKANKELQEEGVQLFYVDGDVCTNALMAVAHDHLLSCDLVYNRSDGGIFGISKEEFDEFKDEHISLRLFKYLICNKPNSPHGYLATYRYVPGSQTSCFHTLLPRYKLLDHTDLGQILYEPPKSDGSTCTLLAASLRLIF